MTRSASAQSARSRRNALNRGSGGFDGPVSAKPSALVGEGRADDRPVGRRDPIAALAEVALEAFKEICPVAGPDDEHVATVVLIAFAAEIAECPERVQGASDDRL